VEIFIGLIFGQQSRVSSYLYLQTAGVGYIIPKLEVVAARAHNIISQIFY